MKRTRIRAVSARRRRRDAAYAAARRKVYDRAHDVCEARCTHRCEIVGTEVHHIAGRGGPDPHRLDNLLLCCAHCHRFIHDQPALAYERGWMRRRNSNTPEAPTPMKEAWDA